MKPNISQGMLVSEAQGLGFRYLRTHEIADPATDARVLMAHALGISRDKTVSASRDIISADVARAYARALSKRAARAPVSHITGQREFYGRNFAVGPSVLDPRPETELLIDIALEQPFGSVLDLGTGSGCILLTLLLERPQIWGVGIEKSAAAWRVAAQNRDAMGLSGRAVLRGGHWFDEARSAVPDNFAGFDLIISNPPYIAAVEMAQLQPEVRDHEPRIALTDEADGFKSYREICQQVTSFLNPNGRLIVEIGPTQADQVQMLFEQAGLTDLEIRNDLDGRDRAVIGNLRQDNAI